MALVFGGGSKKDCAPSRWLPFTHPTDWRCVANCPKEEAATGGDHSDRGKARQRGGYALCDKSNLKETGLRASKMVAWVISLMLCKC